MPRTTHFVIDVPQNEPGNEAGRAGHVEPVDGRSELLGHDGSNKILRSEEGGDEDEGEQDLVAHRVRIGHAVQSIEHKSNQLRQVQGPEKRDGRETH